MQRYKIRFFFDWSGDCLWSGDEVTDERYGYPIFPADLPLPDELIQQCKLMATRWIARGCGNKDRAFKADATHLLDQIRLHLGGQFEVVEG
jgi:hypothetical protein